MPFFALEFHCFYTPFFTFPKQMEERKDVCLQGGGGGGGGEMKSIKMVNLGVHTSRCALFCFRISLFLHSVFYFP